MTPQPETYCARCDEPVEPNHYGDYRCEECGFHYEEDGPEPDYDAVTLDERHMEAWREDRYGD